MTFFEQLTHISKLNNSELAIYEYVSRNITVVRKMNIRELAETCYVSITRSDNNQLQNLSDINFYVFADELLYNDNDITTRVSFFSILDILTYDYICNLDPDACLNRPQK